MRHRFFDTTFTPSVQAEQTRHGSRVAYARMGKKGDESEMGAILTEEESTFIAQRDSFYLATVSETGWPYVQHRGGPVGFVRLLDDRTIGWADFAGNKQYVSVGNATMGNRAALFFMDYVNRRRLKLLGHMTVHEVGDDPSVTASLSVKGYRAKVEHSIIVKVEAFDWNCSQHITPKFNLTEMESVITPLRRQISDLHERLLTARSAPYAKSN